MDIQIDSREHKEQLKRVRDQLERAGCRTFISKLYVGDYMNLDNPRIVVDRKKDLLELCSNVCQQHERFKKELIRAREAGIQIVILCEHGRGIKDLTDVWFWENPRLKRSPKATTGKQLYKSLCTIRDRYGVRFEFCDKRQTGSRIVELIRNERQGLD